MKIIAKCILLSLMAAIPFFAACEKVDLNNLEDDLQQILIRDTVFVKDTVHIKDTVMLIGANVDKVTFPHEGGSFCISIDSSLEYEVEPGADWIVIGENCSTPSEALHVIIEKNPTQQTRTAILSIFYAAGQTREITVEQDARVLFAGGAGTVDNPYLIATSKDLVTLSDYMEKADSAARYKSKHYLQIADIDMSSVTAYAPVGVTTPFAGVYDGGNYKISGLVINQTVSGKPAGLFGFAGEGAVIRNVVINGIKINSTSYYTGAIVGDEYCSTIENCVVSGADIKNTGAPSEGDYKDASLTGGLVGHAYEGVVKGCKFDGTVYASTHRAGGIIGVASSSETGVVKVIDSEFSGSVSTGWITGGIIGFGKGGVEITGCVSRGKVSSTGNSAGGIIGRICRGAIKDCVFSSAGDVNVAKNDAGGIVGMVYSSGATSEVLIDNCASCGKVSALINTGGILGLLDHGANDKLVISNSVAYGCEVQSTGKDSSWNWQMAGGVCGYLKGAGEAKFVNCLAFPETVSVVLAAGGGIGGFAGYIEKPYTFENCAVCMSPSDILYNSGPVTNLSNGGYYGAFFGRSTKAAEMKNCYASSGIQFGPTNGSEVRTSCVSMGTTEMTDGTLLAILNDNASALAGAKTWVAGENGYPILSDCPSDPDKKSGKTLRISVIGDSISTFAGWVPNGYGCHYPKTDEGYDVNSVEQTWWHRFIYHYMSSARLDMNLSYSGTTVVKNSTDDSDKYYYGKDFCARYLECGGMGRPDVILLHGGTNDCWQTPRNEYLLGTQSMLSANRPSDEAMAPVYQAADACTTLDQAKSLDNSTFVSAYVKLIRMMQLQYPSVKIVCVIGDHVGTDDHHAIQESIIHIAEHYNSHCRVVDFPSLVGWQTTGAPLSKAGGSHPDAAGMDYMASEIYKAVGSWLAAE